MQNRIFIWRIAMNNMITMTDEQTMSSQEIADLLEARHDKVKQSIERLVERGVISQPPTGNGIKSANGVVVKEYRIGKRDSYVIVAQLSPEFTARLVDRWQELEAGTPKLTYSQALRKLADAVEAEEIAKNRVTTLQITLDQNAEWSSVKRMEKLHKCRFDYHPLVEASRVLGHERKDVFDQNYGTVRAYHRDAWFHAYRVEI
jgi:phage regulator Rha-like protein